MRRTAPAPRIGCAHRPGHHQDGLQRGVRAYLYRPLSRKASGRRAVAVYRRAVGDAGAAAVAGGRGRSAGHRAQKAQRGRRPRALLLVALQAHQGQRPAHAQPAGTRPGEVAAVQGILRARRGGRAGDTGKGAGLSHPREGTGTVPPGSGDQRPGHHGRSCAGGARHRVRRAVPGKDHEARLRTDRACQPQQPRAAQGMAGGTGHGGRYARQKGGARAPSRRGGRCAGGAETAPAHGKNEREEIRGHPTLGVRGRARPRAAAILRGQPHRALGRQARPDTKSTSKPHP